MFYRKMPTLHSSESDTSSQYGIRCETVNDQQPVMSMIDELTKKEKEAYEQLKTRISDVVPPHLKDDIYFYLRFLRARDFNISSAESTLRKHIEWRKANGIDTILTDFVQPEVTSKYVPMSRIGFDKEGAPVRYLAFGNMDSKGILKCIKRSDCVKSFLLSFEEDINIMMEQSKKLGKNVDQWTYIFDCENYSLANAMHKPTLEIVVDVFTQYEANYPERLKAAYIINASIYFKILFAVMKPLLSGATIKKIMIFRKDGWKEELLKSIDPEILPAFLGGNKTDPDGDPTCKSFIKHGEMVPKEYYMSNSTNRLSSQPDVQKIMVARRSKFNLNFEVTESGSLIKWEFETAGKDIAFELLFKCSTTDDSTEVLIPNRKVDTHLFSEDGKYHCERPGTYVLVFDNSYSWLSPKEIFYKTSLVSPKDLNSQA